ncbi:MAG: hypothetical protein FJY65_08340 [Calditrichaeota bacterium]|nr:hypothetical protein [Calditrichota bacterium]
MESDNPIDPELQRILAAKSMRRKELAALPIEEKIRILVRMQEMVAPLIRARGKEAVVWKIDA